MGSVPPLECKKMNVFYHTAPYSLLEIDRRFGCVYSLHHQGDRPEKQKQSKPDKNQSISTFFFNLMSF
jgi:hypothetical protein